ncbi:putative plant lipid transfer protein/Par allergen [Medicago truncatula]|uniref:Putative plant lipid transfer protein/Par allergen n=1 Tax=Medicago truncatula TaxID=3880 RepID=A0A396IN43_MEDTR|nr:non-specific lipid-transfer protein-like [Medicago truncatula]RHN66720.1 putative plant lipid transfer protein/Par allergen [Medicago truncatula]
MSAKKNVSLFVPLMVLSMLMTTLYASQINDITCSEAISSLLPCLPFLEGSLPATPSTDCCAGATNLFHKVDTTKIQRKNICHCLKNTSTKFGVNSKRSKQLPQLCHINLSFSVDTKIDCNSMS